MTIKRFNEFENNKFKNIKPVNEFFGGIIKQLLKNAKENLSIKVSKKIGGAAEADKAIEKYKAKVEPLIDKELEAEKKLIEYEMGMKETGGDEKELDKVRKEVEKEKDNIQKMKGAAKKVFNTNISNILSKEDDKNIKGYINLKRAELAEELLAKQLGQLKEMGAENLKGDDKFEQWVDGLEQKAAKSGELAKKMFKKLSDKLKSSEKPVEYKVGDKVKYIKKDGEENEGEVMDQEGVEEGFLKLKTDGNKAGFIIKKDKVIGKVEQMEADAESDAESDEDMSKLSEEEN